MPSVDFLLIFPAKASRVESQQTPQPRINTGFSKKCSLFFAKINTHAEHECRKQNIGCESHAACEGQDEACIVTGGNGNVTVVGIQRSHEQRLGQEGITCWSFGFGHAVLHTNL